MGLRESATSTTQRLKELGASGLLQPIKLSCADHEGGGAVRFQQWDGAEVGDHQRLGAP